jgi:hypothetical protein
VAVAKAADASSDLERALIGSTVSQSGSCTGI